MKYLLFILAAIGLAALFVIARDAARKQRPQISGPSVFRVDALPPIEQAGPKAYGVNIPYPPDQAA